MRKFLTALSLTASLLLPQTALAWNATGHMTVAYIAYKSLGNNARTQVDQLLQWHPDYPKWVNGLPEDVQLRGLVAFLHAATWPDDIKSDPRFSEKPPTPPIIAGFPNMLRNREWHFINVPFSPDNTPFGAVPTPNAETKIDEFRNAIGNTSVPIATRVYDLPWLIHLTGDIHQPLHSVARFTQLHPQGDRGGNSFLLNDPTGNLHAFWDDLLGTDLSSHFIVTLATGIMNERPYTPSAPTPTQTWRNESVQIAERFVYTVGNEDPHDPPSVSPSYRSKATTIARFRVAQAGHRLADILNTLFPTT